jgi:hypothetical protein
VDADHAGAEERLRIEDAPIDVRFRREVDDGVDVGDERLDVAGLGDVPLDEREPGSLLGIRLDWLEVRAVARVGELVEDRHPRPVPPAQDLANVGAADEAGPAGHEQAGEGVGHAVAAWPSRPGVRRAGRGGRRRRRRGQAPRPG